MMLVDTSVWIEHFRHGEPVLREYLSEEVVLMHPFVSGELACGNLKNRATVLSDLAALPMAGIASNAEVFRLLDSRRLWGRGLGWIDLHLLASALIAKCAFWTLDQRLARAAKELGLAAPPR